VRGRVIYDCISYVEPVISFLRIGLILH